MSETSPRKILTKPVVAYCDGSYNPTTRFGGWSFLVMTGDKRVTRSGSCEGEAPSDFEVLAAVKLLEATSPDTPLLVNCDCLSVVQAATKLLSGKSLRYGHMRAALRELYLKLAQLLSSRAKVTFKWVKAHAGIKGNVTVDRLAKACMRSATRSWEAAMDSVYAQRDAERARESLPAFSGT